MTTNETTDIAQIAMEELKAATAPEKVRAVVSERIQKTVTSAINDATREYSPFGRELEKRISEALNINNLDLPSYGAMVSSMVEEVVHANVSEIVSARLKTDIADLLKIAPATIKLSEIVRWMTEKHEDEGYGEVVTCEVRSKERGKDIWGPEWDVYLDEDDHHLYRNAEEAAAIKVEIWHGIKKDHDQDNGEIHTGVIRAIYENGRPLVRSGNNGAFSFSKPYGLTQRLLALYAAETVIEIDEDEVCISVGDY